MCKKERKRKNFLSASGSWIVRQVFLLKGLLLSISRHIGKFPLFSSPFSCTDKNFSCQGGIEWKNETKASTKLNVKWKLYFKPHVSFTLPAKMLKLGRKSSFVPSWTLWTQFILILGSLLLIHVGIFFIVSNEKSFKSKTFFWEIFCN